LINVFHCISNLLAHLLVARDEVVILDMEAGIEHLGRGTAGMVDKLIVVVEPGRRSIETATNIKKLASEIGVQNVAVVGNKVRNQSDRKFLTSSLPGFEFLGFIPYDQAVVDGLDYGLLCSEPPQYCYWPWRSYGWLPDAIQIRHCCQF
ncbi:hypothetical protein ACFLT4_08025, partial [Chloroflexota bacterium]